jgi:hypothetical protein
MASRKRAVPSTAYAVENAYEAKRLCNIRDNAKVRPPYTKGTTKEQSQRPLTCVPFLTVPQFP